MIKELRPSQTAEPACQRRSDGDHLRFIIKNNESETDGEIYFLLELGGIKTWAVQDRPSMNPMDHKLAKEKEINKENLPDIIQNKSNPSEAWDKGSYIPIDDHGNVLNENEAMRCLKEGILTFFLQGSKLVGEFVLMKKGKTSWLLMKRHDEFALYK